MKIWMTHAMSFQNGRINAKTDGLACFSDGWGGVVCVCCLYRPPGVHIRLPVSHLGVCMSTSNPQRRDIRLPGRRFCVKQVCMSWPCSCMDLTLLMWMIIPTLAQIMKRMLETLYRCDKIYVFPTCTKLTHRLVGVIFFVSSNSLFHKPLSGIWLNLACFVYISVSKVWVPSYCWVGLGLENKVWHWRKNAHSCKYHVLWKKEVC